MTPATPRSKEATSREVRLPGPDHEITIDPSGDRVVVRFGGATIADSQTTLVLRETNYPPVRYIPLADVDQSLLTRSDHTTYCPYKGDASYYSIVADDERGADAVWFYEQPYPAVAAIKDHVAFYSNRVDITASQPDEVERNATEAPATRGAPAIFLTPRGRCRRERPRGSGVVPHDWLDAIAGAAYLAAIVALLVGAPERGSLPGPLQFSGPRTAQVNASAGIETVP